MSNIFAYTAPGSDCPAFVALNYRDNRIVLTARSKGGPTIDVEIPGDQIGPLIKALRDRAPILGS